jgi:hypothetical protein
MFGFVPYAGFIKPVKMLFRVKGIQRPTFLCWDRPLEKKRTRREPCF